MGVGWMNLLCYLPIRLTWKYIAFTRLQSPIFWKPLVWYMSTGIHSSPSLPPPFPDISVARFLISWKGIFWTYWETTTIFIAYSVCFSLHYPLAILLIGQERFVTRISMCFEIFEEQKYLFIDSHFLEFYWFWEIISAMRFESFERFFNFA